MIRQIRNQPNQDVIARLYKLLDQAKQGNIDCLLCLTSGRADDGTPCVGQFVAGPMNAGDILWAFELWKAEAIRITPAPRDVPNPPHERVDEIDQDRGST